MQMLLVIALTNFIRKHQNNLICHYFALLAIALYPRTLDMEFKLAEKAIELRQILALQAQNHAFKVPPEQRISDGFVTVQHDLDLLTKMNASARQVIAVDQEQVVGYALVMTQEFFDLIPVLAPMIKAFDKIEYRGKPLNKYHFYIMGQVCVGEAYRGKGVFRGLYNHHKKHYSTQYDLCITEVSTSNPRSIIAHEKVGFKTIHTFKDQFDEWYIICWDWNESYMN